MPEKIKEILPDFIDQNTFINVSKPSEINQTINHVSLKSSIDPHGQTAHKYF